MNLPASFFLLWLSASPAAVGVQEGGEASAAQARAVVEETAQKVGVLLEQRRFTEAARASEQLVRGFPEDPAAWLVLANCHLRDDWPLRKDGRAEEAAERALELGGRTPPVLVALATAKFRQRKSEEAKALIGELVDGAFSRVDRVTQAELLVMRAQLLLRGEALDPEAREKGRRDLDRALFLVPAHPNALLERAEQFMLDKDYEQARADLELALQSAPGSKNVHWRLKTCYARLGRREDAELHTEIWKILNRLTDSLATQSAPDRAEHIELLRRLAELNPADLDRRLELAWLLLASGDTAAAEAALAELQEAAPRWRALEGLAHGIAQVKSGALDPAQLGGQEPQADEDDGVEGDGGS